MQADLTSYCERLAIYRPVKAPPVDTLDGERMIVWRTSRVLFRPREEKGNDQTPKYKVGSREVEDCQHSS